MCVAMLAGAAARAQDALHMGAASDGSSEWAAPRQTLSPSANSLPDAPEPSGNPRPRTSHDAYAPITGMERLKWVGAKTLGIDDLAAGAIWSGYGTGVNKPREDGPHWGGFAERYGVRLTGIATSNTMEAGLGAIWGEDPRYKPAREKDFSGRVASVLVQTLATRRRDGHFGPAYARMMAVPGSNFLSNAWRPDSEADSYHAGIRALEGFGGVLGGNTWEEFWPSIRERLFHHSK